MLEFARAPSIDTTHEAERDSRHRHLFVRGAIAERFDDSRRKLCVGSRIRVQAGVPAAACEFEKDFARAGEIDSGVPRMMAKEMM
jgi:hypothetical protein